MSNIDPPEIGPTTPIITGIPTPPRLPPIKDLEGVGDAILTLQNYIFRLYAILVQTNEFLRTTQAFDPTQEFDPSQLLDPNTATIPQVAQAANTALLAADNNDKRLDAVSELPPLSQTISAPPTQSEVQAISDKVDEIISAV